MLIGSAIIGYVVIVPLAAQVVAPTVFGPDANGATAGTAVSTVPVAMNGGFNG